jgi:hypothetical protein
MPVNKMDDFQNAPEGRLNDYACMELNLLLNKTH